MNPELVSMACANTFKVNLDLIKWLLDPSYKREICGYACRGGMFELGLLAEHYGLVERDNGHVVNIKSFEADHFKDHGLPEEDIVALIEDRAKFDAYINGSGWLGLAEYVLEHGIFKLQEGYTFVLEGLLTKKGEPDQEKIKERVVAKAWLDEDVTLKTGLLVVTLTDVQKQEVDADHEASWAKWYGCGPFGVGSLAIALTRWHWLSFLHEQNMYPEDVERPADSHALEQRCVGGAVNLDGDEIDDDSDEEGDLDAGEALKNERHGSVVTRAMAAARAAAGSVGRVASTASAAAAKPVRVVLRFGGKCFRAPGLRVVGRVAKKMRTGGPRNVFASDAAESVGVDGDARSSMARTDTAVANAMDVDAGLTPEVAATMTCYDLLKLPGAWALVSAKRGKGPCKKCRSARDDKRFDAETAERIAAKCFEKTITAPAGKRSTRDREPTPEDDEPCVPSCNQIIDIVTGERRDGGTTCNECWKALYDPEYRDCADYVSGELGDGTEQYAKCCRLRTGTIHCPDVSNALVKLEKLAKSRAAGNR